jgi:hypothetical protein
MKTKMVGWVENVTFTRQKETIMKNAKSIRTFQR